MEAQKVRGRLARELGLAAEDFVLLDEDALCFGVDYRPGMALFGASGELKEEYRPALKKCGVRSLQLWLPSSVSQAVVDALQDDETLAELPLVLLEGAALRIELRAVSGASDEARDEVKRKLNETLLEHRMPVSAIRFTEQRTEDVPPWLTLRILQAEQPAKLATLVERVSQKWGTVSPTAMRSCMERLLKDKAIVWERPVEGETEGTYSLTYRGQLMLPHIRKRNSPDLNRLLDLSHKWRYRP